MNAIPSKKNPVQTGTAEAGNVYMSADLKSETNWLMVLGALMTVAGILAMAMPFFVALTVNFLVGSFLIVAGVIQVVNTIRYRGTSRVYGRQHERSSVVFSFITAMLGLGAGILLFAYPLQGVLALTLLLGSYFIAQGIVKIAWALNLRPAMGWGWMLASGVIAAALGFIVWAQWPMSSAWLIGVLLGVDLITTGCAMMAISFAAKTAIRDAFL